MFVEMNEVCSASLIATSFDCVVCGETLHRVPGLFVYRPSLDAFHVICRECAITIMRAARVRISEPEYQG
jgi:predicted RNA-binding Zn-ribbon protein involved in translation (DUF1610 family)